jgi:cytochrome c biogenesis protein CcdA
MKRISWRNLLLLWLAGMLLIFASDLLKLERNAALISVGVGITVLGFCFIILITKFHSGNAVNGNQRGKYRFTYSFYFLGLAVLFIGAILKLEHLVYASSVLQFGIVLSLLSVMFAIADVLDNKMLIWKKVLWCIFICSASVIAIPIYLRGFHSGRGNFELPEDFGSLQ